MPSDLLADLNAVCRTGERTQYIVAAIRARLEGEPAAQRARDDRTAAIAAKAAADQDLNDVESSMFWREVDGRIAKAVKRELQAEREKATRRRKTADPLMLVT